MKNKIKNIIQNLSFALFDSGETILGALVFSTFFPLYIIQYIDTKVYTTVYGFAFIVSFFFALLLGKIADIKGYRKLFFGIFVTLTALFCVLLFFTSDYPILSLLIFSAMAISHQQAFVFYNSMLLGFESRGIVSGLGVAFGYVGSAIALIFLAKMLHIPDAYLITAGIFYILSLPAIFLLKNPEQREEGSIIGVFKEKRFIFTIISILSLTEVANTLIAMMSIYLKKVYGFEDIYIYKIIGFSAIGGIVGGFLWGKITDIFSASKVFPVGFLLWIGFLTFLPLAPSKLVLLVGLSAGFALAHLWTTSRILILEEFPEGQASLRLSFLSLTERIASTTGLLTLSLFLWITADNFKLSAFLMVIFPLVGLYFFYVARKNAH